MMLGKIDQKKIRGKKTQEDRKRKNKLRYLPRNTKAVPRSRGSVLVCLPKATARESKHFENQNYVIEFLQVQG
jgi:hypothetical protein